MNILIFSWRGPGHPNAGGAEISTHEHAKGWVQAGHEVTLFTSIFSGGKPEEIIDGVIIKRYGRQMFGVQWEAFRWYIFGTHTRYDLIVDQFHGIPFFTPLYVREKKLAFIHEVTKEVWKLNPWPFPFNIAASIIGSTLEPLVLKYIYRNIPFMTVSESTKKELINWSIPSENITIIHNGNNIIQSKTVFNKEKKTLIFLGSLTKDKGIEDALKIFAYVSKKSKGWQFWVVGKAGEKYLVYLKYLATNLNIDKNIKFFGFISDKFKYQLLAKAQLLINPSIREGWGLVIIEAASVGTPAVGYNVPGLRDSIIDKKTGILCSANPKSCANEIRKILRDQKNYQRLKENCIKWSKEFSWEKSVNQSLELLEKIRNAN